MPALLMKVGLAATGVTLAAGAATAAFADTPASAGRTAAVTKPAPPAPPAGKPPCKPPAGKPITVIKLKPGRPGQERPGPPKKVGSPDEAKKKALKALARMKGVKGPNGTPVKVKKGAVKILCGKVEPAPRSK